MYRLQRFAHPTKSCTKERKKKKNRSLYHFYSKVHRTMKDRIPPGPDAKASIANTLQVFLKFHIRDVSLFFVEIGCRTALNQAPRLFVLSKLEEKQLKNLQHFTVYVLKILSVLVKYAPARQLFRNPDNPEEEYDILRQIVLEFSRVLFPSSEDYPDLHIEASETYLKENYVLDMLIKQDFGYSHFDLTAKVSQMPSIDKSSEKFKHWSKNVDCNYFRALDKLSDFTPDEKLQIRLLYHGFRKTLSILVDENESRQSIAQAALLLKSFNDLYNDLRVRLNVHIEHHIPVLYRDPSLL